MINWLKSKFQWDRKPHPRAGLVRDYMDMGDGTVEEIWITPDEYKARRFAELLGDINSSVKRKQAKGRSVRLPPSPPPSRIVSDDDSAIRRRRDDSSQSDNTFSTVAATAILYSAASDSSSYSSSSYDSGSSCDSSSSVSCD